MLPLCQTASHNACTYGRKYGILKSTVPLFLNLSLVSSTIVEPDILNPPFLRLTSRKLLWLDLQPVDIKSRWRHDWKSAQVVNSHLVCDPTIRQPGFDLPRQQWSLLNRFRTERGHCGACRRKWRHTDTDLCQLWRDPDDVSHCRILSPDKTEWWLISATLCG